MKTQITLLLVGGLLAQLAIGDEDINESAAAETDGNVEIVNTAGTISVTGWNKSEIEITGTLGEGVKRLDFERDGNDTLIRVVLPKSMRNVEATHLKIKVPSASSIEAQGVSADITVSGVTGEQELESVSGDIETEVADKDADLQSVSGNLSVTGNGGLLDLNLESVSGDIVVSGTGGSIRVEAVSGDITLNTEGLSKLTAETVNGDIAWLGDLLENGKIDAETINGNVDLVFADAANLDVEVESFNGSIKTCLGFESTRKSQYGPGNSLEFESGKANRVVRVEVLNGRVNICDK